MLIMESIEIKKKIQELLNKGMIHPSTSPCGSPIILVPKKDGCWHIWVDFSAPNKIMVKNHYQLTRIDYFLYKLRYGKYFTNLYLRSGYHQVIIAEEDIWKTTFKTKQRLFEWLVMPFGITNAPTTFMRVMNDILRPFIDYFVIVYLDYILKFNKSKDEHVMHDWTKYLMSWEKNNYL